MVAFLAISVVACDRAKPTGAPGTPSAATARSTLPLSFARTTADAQVRLTLPAALAASGALHEELYRGEVRRLESFLRTAAQDRGVELRAGIETPTHFDQVIWSVTAETPRLLALVREESVYTGGAHPNHALRGLLIDRRGTTELQPTAFFRPDAAFGALDQALCDAILSARRARAAGERVDTATFDCPAWRAARFTLAPSTVPGKIGGLVFLFSPYEVGPYAEGPYEVAIPLTVFAEALSPVLAGEFAGSPRRLPPRPRPVPPVQPEGGAQVASAPGAVAESARTADAR